jgi:hypothetical protein
VNFRTVFLARRQRRAIALGTEAERLKATLHTFLHVSGLWTFCFPRKESTILLEGPPHRHLLVDFVTEMKLFLQAILSEAISRTL